MMERVREKWCHLNGEHGAHEWGSSDSPLSCPGNPREEDYEPEPEPCEMCLGTGKIMEPVTLEMAEDAENPNLMGTDYAAACDACRGSGQAP